MSERTPPAEQAYSPFDRLEDRSQLALEFLSIALAVGGIVLGGEQYSLIAGAVLLALWTRLRSEFVFAAGAILLAAFGGAPESVESVVGMAGLAGFLAADSARSWGSVRPVVGFLALFALVGAGVVHASEEVGVELLRVGAGAAAALVAVSYGLHRYELVRVGRGGAPTGANGERSDGEPNRDGNRERVGEHDPDGDRRSEVT